MSFLSNKSFQVVSLIRKKKLWAGTGVIIGLLLIILYCLPLPETLVDQRFSTALYAEDGELLSARISEDEQWRFPNMEHLPEKYISALLLFEDQRFFYHPGVDPIAVCRATVSNLSERRVVSGASTITMQLARLVLGDNQRTFTQKFKEMILAFQLEMHFSKEEILHLYASHAPFGGNNVGLAAANWRYFRHRPDKMTWAEAALFAVLPNAPSSISPGKNRDKLLLQRNNLLQKLYLENRISEMDLKLAKLEPLPERPKSLPAIAPHFLATLKNRYPKQFLFNSTLDSRLQLQVGDVANNHIAKLGQKNINNLSVLVIDNLEGKVIAYQGNTTYQTIAEYAPSLDIAQRPRSSGSLFKPFLFALMLQRGDLTSESLVLDIPSYYSGYKPENYDHSYRGAVTAQQALIQSLNVPAVKLLKDYGVGPFKEDMQDAGLSTLFRAADDYGLSLILGGAETTLWDITNAYAGLSLSAYGQASRFNKAVMLQNESPVIKAFPVKQGAAWLTLETLKNVKRPGIGAVWEEFSSSQQIAWKTGTSYGWRDAWAVGTNGKYTVGVWAGNANAEEGRELTGSKAAAPVMFDTFRLLKSGPWPEKPVLALKQYTVCKDDGYLVSANCEVKEVDMPRDANFSKVSEYHVRIHLDERTGQRVNSDCEAVSNMKASSHFVLPPVAEYFYQKVNPNYSSMPRWRSDCKTRARVAEGEVPMQLEYPIEGAKIKIPVELNGNLGRVVFKAHHRSSSSILHWHLDSDYLGDTRYMHEKAIAVNAGWHKLVLVDEKGYELSRWFKVI